MSLEARVAELEARVVELTDQLVNVRGVLRTQRLAFLQLFGRGRGFSSSDSGSEDRGVRRRPTSLPPVPSTLQASILSWARPSSSPQPAAEEPADDQLTWAEREELAVEIGEWLSLSLEGAAPILSGRERLQLGSSIWVVVRDFAGQIYTPVRVFRTWSGSGTPTSKREVADDGVDEAEQPHYAPGAGASTVNVPGLLNSLPRIVLKTRGAFSGFLLTIVANHKANDAFTSTAGCTWPCPLPYPEVFKRGLHAPDPKAHFKRLTCLQVALLDWLSLGSPGHAPASIRLGSPLNARQWSMVRMLEHLSVDRNFPEFVEAFDMGRCASKIEDFQACMDALGRTACFLHGLDGAYSALKPSQPGRFDEDGLLSGRVVGKTDRDPVVTAKTIVASRISFPDPPSFDPRPYFDSSTLERYDKPISKGLHPSEVSEAPPRVSVRATPKNKLALFAKLAASGRLKPIPKASFHSGYISGFFAVNEERVSRNVLCASLTPEESKVVFGDSFSWNESPVFVGLSTLAMGDRCAVEFAQCSHWALCLQHGVVDETELLTLHGSIPRGLLQVGIIVDDLVILEQLLKADKCVPERPTLADGRISKAREAFIKLLWPICLITLRVATLGLSTVSLLDALAGSWVSLLGLRRKLYSMLNLVFEPLGIADQKKIIRLSPELIDELVSLVVVGILGCVNLRAVFYDRVVATDASECWMAGVTAPFPEKVVAEVSRFSLRKGVWTKLLTPLAVWEKRHGILDETDELPGDAYKAHPLWTLLATSLEFSESWREQVRRPTHIKILELRSHLRHEKRIAARNFSKRVLHGIDSQVCLGCVIKGRSSSAALNAELKRSIPHSIGSDIYGNYMYFPSGINPADNPTRDREVDGPSVPLPNWWDSLSQGSVHEFDQWLEQLGLSHHLSDLDFSELWQNVPVDLSLPPQDEPELQTAS
eukprot:s84_g3.t1